MDEIAKLEALYASNPDGRVFTHLAEAYRKSGEFDRARTILEQGLAKHPAYASAHVVLGRVFIDLNQPEEASESFRRVLQLDPHNLVALRSLGDLARTAGRNAEALGYFEELRHQDPSNEELEGIIADLLASPGPGVEAPQPTEAAAAAVEEPTPAQEETAPEPPAPYEPEPMFEAATELPDFGASQPDFGDLVSSEVDLGWAGDDAEGEQPLPGDLAGFAELSAATDSQDAFGDVDLNQPPPADMPMDLGGFDVDLGEPPAVKAEEAPIDFGDFGNIGEVPPPPPEPVTPAPQGEVMTETMAELYRNQGLHERAVEVYRALLRERPEDAQLQSKLAEVEALARGETAQPAEEAPPFIPTAPEAPEEVQFEEEVQFDEVEVDEPFVAPTSHADEEIDSPWTSNAAAGANTPTPYAWAEEPASGEESRGPAVTEYFRSLLSWKPAQPVQSSFAPASEVEEEPGEILDLGEPMDTADEPLFEEPVVPEPPPAPRSPAPSASSDAELMPWEEPPAFAAPSPAPVAAGPSNSGQEEDAFDEWFGAPEPSTSEAGPASAENTDEPAPVEGEDDDDLEMFRSWLQSLKK